VFAGRLIFCAVALFVIAFSAQIARAETVYFLVGETHFAHGDSYIVALTDPNDIARARDIIQGGQPQIVVAEIVAEPDGINRDYFDPNKSIWHWHVTQFLAFAEATIEILDGWPGGVELGYNSGMIGFWSYTVVAELGTDPKHWNRDFNQDGQIDYQDYNVIAQKWANGGCAIPDWCGGTDLNKNGTVDFNDLRIFSESWLSPFASRPLQPLWFSAWDCPYQCHGDADCLAEGKTSYRVYTKDLSILTSALTSRYGDQKYDPRADFDRDGDVDAGDQAILTTWYEKTNVPADCQ
jgi:hypothetical protein